MNREELATKLFQCGRNHVCGDSSVQTWSNVSEKVRELYRALADEAIKCLTPNAA